MDKMCRPALAIVHEPSSPDFRPPGMLPEPGRPANLASLQSLSRRPLAVSAAAMYVWTEYGRSRMCLFYAVYLLPYVRGMCLYGVLRIVLHADSVRGNVRRSIPYIIHARSHAFFTLARSGN